jgi:hypothetical protein
MGALDQPAPLSPCSGLELRDRQANGGGRAFSDEEAIALLDVVQEQGRQSAASARITPTMVDATVRLVI